MLNTFGKLLCAAVLATTAFAQTVSVVSPAAGTQVSAGSQIVVELAESSSSTSIHDVVLLIGFIACVVECSDPSQELGTVIYQGSFSPNPTENITVTIPDFYDGLAQLGVAHFYLSGAYSIPELKFANTTVNVIGASG